MISYRPRHEIACTPERFWEAYFDHGFQHEMLVEGLGWDPPTLTDLHDDEDRLEREMTAYPRIEVPGAVARLIRSTLGFTEQGRFEKIDRVYHMKQRTNIFGDRVDIGGKFWLEKSGDSKCLRVADLYVDAHIFGVGRVLEKAVEHNMKKGWDTSARFFNRWCARNPVS